MRNTPWLCAPSRSAVAQFVPRTFARWGGAPCLAKIAVSNSTSCANEMWTASPASALDITPCLGHRDVAPRADRLVERWARPPGRGLGRALVRKDRPFVLQRARDVVLAAHQLNL